MSELIKNKSDLDNRLAAGKPLLILFYSQRCPYCLAFQPAFERCAKAAPGSFARASTDDMPYAGDKYSIDVVPTVLFFKEGEVTARLDGTVAIGLTEARLNAFITSCGFPG